jgi:NitT/TauT family transport system substrate-binding protein
MPPTYVDNGLTTKAIYTSELAADKGQFLSDGLMPPGAPQVALAVDKLAGNVTAPVNMTPTYTNSFALAANRLLGYAK